MDIVFYLWQLKNYFFGLARVLVGSLPQLVYLKVKHCIFCTSGYTFMQVKHLFKLAFSFFFHFQFPVFILLMQFICWTLQKTRIYPALPQQSNIIVFFSQ